MLKIATPISNLFIDKKCASILIEKSDCLEVRDDSINSIFPNIELFHCAIQPIHELHETKFEYLKKIKSMHPDLKLITFHCASSCNKAYVEGGMFQVGGNNYEKEEMLSNAKYNFSKIKRIFGTGVKVGIENNNYYPTAAYNYITDSDFISEIVYENQIYLLMDIAHARITARNKNLDYEKYKSGLPLDRLIQLHISAYGMSKGLAHDIHDHPKDKEFNEVKDIISKYDVKYLTVEYYKDIDYLLTSLQRTREVINDFYGTSF